MQLVARKITGPGPERAAVSRTRADIYAKASADDAMTERLAHKIGGRSCRWRRAPGELTVENAAGDLVGRYALRHLRTK